jgi:hypothetical protein
VLRERSPWWLIHQYKQVAQGDTIFGTDIRSAIEIEYPHPTRSLHPPLRDPGEVIARIHRRKTVTGLINEYHRAI